MDDFNQFAQARFARTQPAEWRSTPFADDRQNWRLALKIAGIAVLWIALLALSLWSISQQETSATVHTLKTTKGKA